MVAGFTLVMVLLVALNHQVVVSQSVDSSAYHFTHPTFDHAAFLPIENGGYAPVMKTGDKTAVREAPSGNRLVKYNNSAFAEYNLLASAEFLFPTDMVGPNKVNGMIGRTFYDKERERVNKTFFIEKTFTIPNSEKIGCHRYAFRAFDLIQIRNSAGNLNKLYGVGVDQGHGCCLIYYNSVDLTSPEDVFNESKISVSRMVKYLPKTRYKISSLWGVWIQGTDNLRIGLLDEAGYHYITTINTNPPISFVHTNEQTNSYSSIKLDTSLSSEFRFHDTQIEAEINKTADNGLDVMKRHFRHAFVEAITFYNDSLAYSRGMFLEGEKPLNTIQAGQGAAPFFSRFVEKNIEHDIIVAFEMYDYNGKHILQMGTIQQTIKDTKLYYHYCQVSDPKLLETHNDWQEAFTHDKENYCKKGNFIPYLMPIDIIYMESCKKTVLFYPHAYQMFEPDVPMNLKDKQPPFKIVKWMDMPANAFLFHRNRLYMFCSGNELWISKEVSDCSLDKIVWDQDANTQSQLLLRFEDRLKGRGPHGAVEDDGPEELLRAKRDVDIGHSEQKPNFLSRRHKLNGAWDPPLNHLTAIQPGHELKGVKDFPTPSPTSSTTFSPGPTSTRPPTPPPTPPPNQHTSIIVVVIIIVIIVAIVLGSIYYFCFGDADEPVAKPKSTLRKQKTIPMTQPAIDAAAAGTQPAQQRSEGSKLASAATVRSSIGPKQDSPASTPSSDRKSRKTLKSSKSILKASPAKLAATKSTKSKANSPGVKSVRSPGNVGTKSVRSPSNVGNKSVRSPGTSPAHKSSTGSKSPATKSSSKSPADPASTLSKVKSVSSLKKSSPQANNQTPPSASPSPSSTSPSPSPSRKSKSKTHKTIKDAKKPN